AGARCGADVDAALRSAAPAPGHGSGAVVRRRRKEAIPVGAATTRGRTPGRLGAEAVGLARAAAEEAAAPGVVGEHEGMVSEGDRVVTHFFGCRERSEERRVGKECSPRWHTSPYRQS